MPDDATTAIPSYDLALKNDLRWALDEGGFHFEGKSEVQKTLRRITKRLDDLGIRYAVAGGMALFAHGYERFTTDVDILVTRDGLKTIHDRLEGLGYVPPFDGSKNLRDTDNGVRIEFLISGDYPGDGKPKPVAFPNPAESAMEKGGIHYLSLPAFIELKLASGMTGGMHRMKDLVDVIAILKARDLPREFVEELNPYVREKYLELWDGTEGTPREP